MEYVFGNDLLKTIGPTHTDLEGWQDVVRKYPTETILDHFKVECKVRTADDAEGRCYDWYEISGHYRQVDRTGPVSEATAQCRADLDYLSMMTGVELMTEEEVAPNA